MKIRKFNENVDDKPRLKMEMVSIIRVDYDDLEEFIKKVYGFKYEIIAEEELDNDSSNEYYVSDDIDDDGSWTDVDVENVRNGKNPGSYSLQLILNILCDDGHIPSGNYMMFCDYE